MPWGDAFLWVNERLYITVTPNDVNSILDFTIAA